MFFINAVIVYSKYPENVLKNEIRRGKQSFQPNYCRLSLLDV